MDTRKEMIVIQGVIKTCKVALCEYNREMYSWNVWYNDGRFSIYRYDEVEKLTNPKVLNPVEYRISRNGKEFFNIEEIYVFNGREEEYWHICFKKEIQGDYFRRDLSIDKSILSQGNEANKFEYMKQIAELSDLRNNRSLDVVCHFPLNKLIRSSELLSDEERRYVAQSGTHVDFLIYSRLGKKPILAIEVDGYEYHQAESKQAFRDSKKNHIFELYKIPLLRFCTNGSGEKQQIIEKLEEVMG